MVLSESRRVQSVEQIVRARLCIGCGACTLACPHHAITLSMDSYSGIRIPEVRNELCTRCGSCLQVCYGYGVHIEYADSMLKRGEKNLIEPFDSCFVGNTITKRLGNDSSSGGIVTSIIKTALEQGEIDGAIVTGFTKTRPPQTRAYIATDVDSLVRSRGSKYSPVAVCELLGSLNPNERYAIVGLPCHIYAARKIARLKPLIGNQIQYYIGLFCGGMPSYAATSYLFEKYGILGSQVNHISYRSGNWPGNLHIQTTGVSTKEITIPYPEYWNGVERYFFSRRCVLCNDAFNTFADIACGDSWKIRGYSSIIISRNAKGARLLNIAACDSSITLDRLNCNDILKSQDNLVRFKFNDILIRIQLNKLLGRLSPIQNVSYHCSFQPWSFIKAIDLEIGQIFASLPQLWPALDAFMKMKRITGSFFSKE